MLAACGVCADVQPRILGGTPFLCFEASGLTPLQTAFLQGHSSLYMTAALEGDLLRPLESARVPFLPEDLPEILKYKGKTNTDFTRMMINLSLCAGNQWQVLQPRIVDPLCGKATTLFCALCRGMDATGIETDGKSLREAADFAKKHLQYHRIKHSSSRGSLTLSGGKGVPAECISIQNQEKTAELCLICADTRQAGDLLRKKRANALVADLPYGVQHAPRENGRMDTLAHLLEEALPAWRKALLPGCAAAIAFNTYTMKRSLLEKLAANAGFTLPDGLYSDFSHWVEQAVARDVLIAINPQ